MDNNKIIDDYSSIKPAVHEVITEWKRRKMEDEKEFLRELKDPEHQKKIELIRGKTVKNESASA